MSIWAMHPGLWDPICVALVCGRVFPLALPQHLVGHQTGACFEDLRFFGTMFCVVTPLALRYA
eukprot:361780-Chlamydomonas_euryale.AAC.6